MMKAFVKPYLLSLISVSAIVLTGCAALKETGGNHAYADPHHIDNTNTPPRPIMHSLKDFNDPEYQQRLRQWQDLTGKK